MWDVGEAGMAEDEWLTRGEVRKERRASGGEKRGMGEERAGDERKISEG